MTTEEKLVHFQENAMETARTKSNAEIDAYTENLNAIYKEHCERARRQSQMQLRTAKEALYRERNKKMSKAQLETRRRLALAKSEIEEQLFTEVKKLLSDYQKSDAYLNLLKQQIKEAEQIAGHDKIDIFLDSSDSDKKETLELETGLGISISGEAFLGGIRAAIPARNILIDQSFISKLKEAREHIQLGGEAHV